MLLPLSYHAPMSLSLAVMNHSTVGYGSCNYNYKSGDSCTDNFITILRLCFIGCFPWVTGLVCGSRDTCLHFNSHFSGEPGSLS